MCLFNTMPTAYAWISSHKITKMKEDNCAENRCFWLICCFLGERKTLITVEDKLFKAHANVYFIMFNNSMESQIVLTDVHHQNSALKFSYIVIYDNKYKLFKGVTNPKSKINKLSKTFPSTETFCYMDKSHVFHLCRVK